MSAEILGTPEALAVVFGEAPPDHGFVPPIDYFDEPMDNAALAEPATIERLAKLADDAGQLEREITADTVSLAEKQARLAKIIEDQIPTILKELGMTEFKMIDGRKVELKSDVRTHIKEDNKAAAYAWLEKGNYDGIIKTVVTAEFGKGENESATNAVSALEEAGFAATKNQSIHAATLKSFVKERLEAGEMPQDMFPVFGIFPFDVAKITAPKAPKKPRNKK